MAKMVPLMSAPLPQYEAIGGNQSAVSKSLGPSFEGDGRAKSMPWGSSKNDSGRIAAHSFIQTRRMGMNLGLGGYMSWLNVLLIFVPLGIVSGMLEAPQYLVFSFNFLAILPLAMILGRATEDIASHTNETLGGLLNATFGNAVELIMSIQALRAGLMNIIKATLIGSILSNLLLVMGMSILLGGFFYMEQKVNPVVSEANAGLLIMCLAGFLLPTVYSATMSPKEDKNHYDENVSLVAAVLLLCLYASYLIFQLFTHASLYGGTPAEEEEEEEEELDEEREEMPSLWVAMTILTVSVLLVAVNSDYLVESVDGFAHRLGIGDAFVSLMLLPLVGNAAEHMSAVTVAMKDKLDLSVGIACGSSVQIAAFVAPLMVVVSWLPGFQHLTLTFPWLEMSGVIISIFLVNTMLRDFRTNWLEGALLCSGYLLLAGSIWYRVV